MTIDQIHYLNLFLGSGAIALLVVSAIIFLMFVLKMKNPTLSFVQDKFLLLGFLITLAASGFSLIYSEVVGFLPCYLCWYARVFMFPMTILFGAGLYYKDRGVLKYITPLFTFGFALSLYHNFTYYFRDTSNLPCDASGVSCFQQLIPEFGGNIQIPTLSLISLLSVLVLILVAVFYKRENV